MIGINLVTQEESYTSKCDALDGYFDKLLNDKKEQDFEAEVKDCVNTVKVNGIEKGIDDIVKKPIVDNNEHDVFGW